MEMSVNEWREVDENSIEERYFTIAHITDHMSYQRSLVQGFLMKDPEKKGFFSNNQYKRWFTLDHSTKVLRISTSNDARAMK